MKIRFIAFLLLLTMVPPLFAQSIWRNIASLKRGSDKFTYEYDVQGNLVKEIWSSVESLDGLPPLPPSVLLYKYSSDRIEATNGDIRYVYSLENNKIVSVQCYNWEGLAFESHFTYNGLDQMISCKYKLGALGVTQIYYISWSDGNLIKIEHSNENGELLATAEIAYSEEKQEFGIAPNPLENKTIHPILYRKGFFGSMPQKLPSQMSVTSSDRNQVIKYSYEKEGGYVTKVSFNNHTQYIVEW